MNTQHALYALLAQAQARRAASRRIVETLGLSPAERREVELSHRAAIAREIAIQDCIRAAGFKLPSRSSLAEFI